MGAPADCIVSQYLLGHVGKLEWNKAQHNKSGILALDTQICDEFDTLFQDLLLCQKHWVTKSFAMRIAQYICSLFIEEWCFLPLDFMSAMAVSTSFLFLNVHSSIHNFSSGHLLFIQASQFFHNAYAFFHLAKIKSMEQPLGNVTTYLP
jgi:hypothetical protein